MAEKNIYLDLDGVILDSEKLVVTRKNDYPNLSWNEFFEIIKDGNFIPTMLDNIF